MARYDAAGAGDVVIAINAAVLTHSCHWWVFGDWITWRDHHAAANAAGRPLQFERVCVAEAAIAGMRKHGPAFDKAIVHEWDKLPREMQPPTEWKCYTASAALVLASSLARSIDVYGIDMRGDADYRGESNRVQWNEQRWVHERRVVGDVMRWLDGSGVKIAWHR